MLTLLIILATWTPEYGPGLLQTFWLQAVSEMLVTMGVVHGLSTTRKRTK